MRILFLKIGSFSHANGALISAFEALGIEVDVFDVEPYVHPFSMKSYPLRAPYLLISSLSEYGVKFIQGYKKTAAAFRVMSALCRKRIERDDFDLIFQTQTIFGMTENVTGKPYFIYTDYTHTLSANSENVNGDIDYAPLRINDKCLEMEAKVYKAADHIFCFSNAVRVDLIKTYKIAARKATVVGAGPNTSIPDDFYKVYEGKHILFVGIDFARKGGDLLVEAFARVKIVIPGATLTIIGASPDVKDETVRVLGRVPLNVVQEEYNKADIFVLPSYMEPFGTSFLEAMAYKLPCIRSNIESVADHVCQGVNGDVIYDYSVDGLSEKIIHLLTSPDKLIKYGEAGRRMVLEKYNWASVAKSMVAVMKQIR